MAKARRIYGFLTIAMRNNSSSLPPEQFPMMQRLVDLVGLTVFMGLTIALILAIWAPVQ